MFTLPIWALKVLPYVAIVALVGGAVWYIDHEGYERAEQEAEQREKDRQLQLAATAILIRDQASQTQQQMQRLIADSDNRLSVALRNLDTENKTIVQPTLIKEIHSDPRFTDPSAGITDGMLRAINTARGINPASPSPAGIDSNTGR